MKKKVIKLVVSLAFVALVFSVIASDNTVNAQIEGKIPPKQKFLSLRSESGPHTNVNPFNPSGPAVVTLDSEQGLCYQALIWSDGIFGELKGVLAEEWGYVDPSTFQVKIRPEAHYRKGSSVTAEDVIYSLQIQTKEKYGGIPFSYIKDMEKVDEKTVNFIPKDQYKGSRALVTDLLSRAFNRKIYKKEDLESLVEEYGKDLVNATPFLNNPDRMNPSGPYTFMEKGPRKVTFERVDDYWGNEIGWFHLPRYTQTYLAGSTKAVARYVLDQKAGEMQSAVQASPNQITKNSDFLAAWDADNPPHVWRFNLKFAMPVVNYKKHPIFLEKWFRKALSYGYSAKDTVKLAHGGSAVVNTPGWFSVNNPYFERFLPYAREVMENNFEVVEEGVFGQPFLGHDPELAIEILENHCEGSPEEGWWWPNKEDGEKIGPYMMKEVSGWTVFAEQCKVLSIQLKEIGIDVSPQPREFGTWTEEIKTGEWDMYQPTVFPLPTAPASIARTYNNYVINEGPLTGARSPWNWIAYPRWWSENYPQTENTADEVADIVRELWTMKTETEEWDKAVKKLMSITIPQLQLPFQGMPGLNTDEKCGVITRWVNWSREEDPYPSSCGWAAKPYVFNKHCFPRDIRPTSFELRKGSVESGETVTAEVTLKNEANVDLDYVVYLNDGPPERGPPSGAPDPEKTVGWKYTTVPAGSEKTVEIDFHISETGSHKMTIEEWRIDKYAPGDPMTRTLIVEEAAAAMISPVNLTLSKTAVEPGESTTISADVSNEGGAEGSETIEITLDGETIKSETVKLGPGQTTTISTTTSKSAEGTYTVKAGNLTRTFTVEKREIIIPPGLEEKVTLAIRMAENARSAAVGAGSSAQAARETAKEAVTAAQEAKSAAESAESAATSAQSAAEEAKSAAQAAQTAAEEVEVKGGASTTMVIASMIITIIVVLGGVYAITRKQAT